MNKKYLGVALITVGVGALTYLYYRYYLPRNETTTTSALASTAKKAV